MSNEVVRRIVQCMEGCQRAKDGRGQARNAAELTKWLVARGTDAPLAVRVAAAAVVVAGVVEKRAAA